MNSMNATEWADLTVWWMVHSSYFYERHCHICSMTMHFSIFALWCCAYLVSLCLFNTVVISCTQHYKALSNISLPVFYYAKHHVYISSGNCICNLQRCLCSYNHVWIDTSFWIWENRYSEEDVACDFLPVAAIVWYNFEQYYQWMVVL